MSDVLIIALVTSTVPTLAAMASIYVSLKNSDKLHELHLSLNSRLDQFLALTAASSHAEGVADAQKGIKDG
jgi:hypothetical protein